MIDSYNDIMKLVSDGYAFSRPIYGEWRSTRNGANANAGATYTRAAFCDPMPTLPSGVAGYRYIGGYAFGNNQSVPLMVTKQVNLGSLDISTNVFTDGATMPTQTILGQSVVTPGMPMLEVTTALNSAPGTYTVSYTNHLGNSATTPAMTPTNSAIKYSCSSMSVGAMVRDVTGMTRTGGTTPSGVITVWGLIQLGQWINSPNVAGAMMHNPLTDRFLLGPRLGAGDEIGIFLGTNAARAFHGRLYFICEPS